MNAMYCVEQVRVPPELGTVMKQYTKAVLRDKPQDVYKYSANFFAILCGRPAPFDAEGQLVEGGEVAVSQTSGHTPADGEAGQSPSAAAPSPPLDQHSGEASPASVEQDSGPGTPEEIMQSIFKKYDMTGEGFTTMEGLRDLLEELEHELSLEEPLPSAEEVVGLLGEGETGGEDWVDLLEVRQLLF